MYNNAFKNLVIYLKDRTHRRRRMQGEREIPSFQWFVPQLGATKNLILIFSVVGRDPSTWAIVCYLPSCIGRKLNSQDLNQHNQHSNMECQCEKLLFNPLHQNSGPPILCFLRKRSNYLRGRVTEAEWDGQIFYLLVHFQNSHNSQGWARLKPGALLGLPCGCRGPSKSSAISPGASTSWIGSVVAGAWTGSPLWDSSIVCGDLTHYATMPVQILCFLKGRIDDTWKLRESFTLHEIVTVKLHLGEHYGCFVAVCLA